jgi:phosphatidylglycerol---prolipoprotein diacylglyceryl transferase
VRSTLFYIPHADPIWNIPLFGFGWIFGFLVIVALIAAARGIRRSGWSVAALSDLPIILIFAAAIVWLAPRLEESAGPELTLGIPIRAYGALVLLGIICGIALTAQTARRVGLHPDLVFSLSFAMIVAGFLGARVFYVAEYWDQFSRPTWSETLTRVVNLTDGGLVVYGSFLAAALALWVFVRRHSLPPLAVADLFAPGMMLGLALGRVGCLMNGCCWGGECGQSALGITFPQGSPPFMRQLEDGTLAGMELMRESSGSRSVVHAVEPNSLAQQHGLRPGDGIEGITFPYESEFNRMRSGQSVPEARVTLDLSDGRRVTWEFDQLPPRSRPVYPTQILSSINAALICLTLWAYYPFRRRDGEVFAIMVTVYPISRLLLEMIRTDEVGLLPTEYKLTIAQAISVLLLLAVATLWWYVLSRPYQTAFPASGRDRRERVGIPSGTNSPRDSGA